MVDPSNQSSVPTRGDRLFIGQSYRKTAETDKITLEIRFERLYSLSSSSTSTPSPREVNASNLLTAQPKTNPNPISLSIHAAKSLSVSAFVFQWSLEDNMATLSDLTPREEEILRLVLTGRTNKAIAAEICVSEKTVEFHLHHIYTKIGRRTRVLAGMWAMQQGVQTKTREIPS
jgi:DNA-binding CsgD family transcriptional regulator